MKRLVVLSVEEEEEEEEEEKEEKEGEEEERERKGGLWSWWRGFWSGVRMSFRITGKGATATVAPMLLPVSQSASQPLLFSALHTVNLTLELLTILRRAERLMRGREKGEPSTPFGTAFFLDPPSGA